METMSRRIPLVLIGLGIIAAILIGQLVSFQFRLNPSITEFEEITLNREAVLQRIYANRGEIYDRDGVVLAVNSFEYRVGISPALVIDRQEAATQLATLLNLNEADLYEQLQPDENGAYTPYILLSERPINDATARAVEDLDINGVIIEPVALRNYPQGELTAQIVGFVNYSEQGFYGVEGEYDEQLAGSSREVETDDSPFNIDEIPEARDGQSLVLTLDRDVQFVVKDVLLTAIREQQAYGGTIVVMNPRTGEILGMYSCPSAASEECKQLLLELHPPAPASADAATATPLPPSILEEIENAAYNPAVESALEPGSIMKVVSAAITLEADEPGLDLFWTYNNEGCLDIAGVKICDWDGGIPKGPTDFTSCIVNSWNTCTATWYSIIGHSDVYPRLLQFGFGGAMGVGLEGEAEGIINLPGSSTWNEANYLNISFGQGISVTPLQMLSAVNAIANDGLLVQPHIVKARIDGTQIVEFDVNPVERPISAETADAVTDLMIATVSGETLDAVASLPGYTVAGKTGTAEQPIPGGYSATDTWASFIGFLPADDPAVSALIILDRPRDRWGSIAAAPYFRMLMERLVVLLEIPPDEIRHQLAQAGGNPFARR